MVSIRNLMKRNPGMTAAGIIFLIALIVVIVWLVTKGKKVQAGPGAAAGGEPVLEFELTGTKKVTKVNTTSEYTMRGYEYAAPYLGDNVDFVVTLKTKSGWVEAGVTKVHLYRRKTVDNGDGTSSVVDLIGTAAAPYKERVGIENFGSFDIQLPGSELRADAVGATGGDNTLILVPIKSDGSVFGTGNDVANNGIATTSINISPGDLNYKLDGVTSTDITWDISVPTSASDSSFFAGAGVSTKNRYKIVELAGDNEVSLEPGTAGSNTWKFKVHPTDTSVSAYYITARAPPTDRGTQSDAVDQFKLSKVSITVADHRYRILSGGKLLTWEKTKPTGNSLEPFQLIHQLELTEDQADNTIVTIDAATTDPCKGITDNTPASQVPVACLKKTLLDIGCSEKGAFYTGEWPADAWWRGDDKIGNYGNVKVDMRNWSNIPDSKCYLPPEPCEGITDNTPASQEPVACLKKTLLDIGCSEEGAFYTGEWPVTGWWRDDKGVGNYGNVKTDMKNWSKKPNSACYLPEA